ncbi:adenylosuccinate lyase, partial [candidate division KSB1 bacterium]
MIERYTLDEMGYIWSQENKFKTWLQVEIAACKANHQLGIIPEKSLEIIEKKANFSIKRIKEIEEEIQHDVIAFLTSVAEYVGPESRFIHLGMTSSDLLDTALALLMKQAGELVLKKLNNLSKILKRRSIEFKNTIMMGRTHGVFAEPITFGLKLFVWYEEIKRSINRIKNAIDTISVGKISGAVGTYAHLNPKLEALVCKNLGLKPATVSTQILQRDRHAELMCSLAILAASLEKFATEIRNLQRTEIHEVEEPFKKGQKGSSAMPHKKNPIICERIAGLARLIRTNAFASIENITLWHERDISHSSVERVIIPDNFILTDYILEKFTKIIDNLKVYPENMLKNIERANGLIFSQPLMLTLVKKGMTREEAYKIVQTEAMKSWNNNKHLINYIKENEKIKNILSDKEIEECFNINN